MAETPNEIVASQLPDLPGAEHQNQPKPEPKPPNSGPDKPIVVRIIDKIKKL